MITESSFTETDVYQIIKDKTTDDIYNNSVFREFKRLSSKTKGALFEQLYTEYKLSQGIPVSKPINTGHDRIVDGKKVEIKGSFLWGNGSHFRWQQIRPAQDYDEIVFISVYPDRITFHKCSKEVITQVCNTQDELGNWIYNQHGGKTTNSGTFCLDGFPNDFEFMKEDY